MAETQGRRIARSNATPKERRAPEPLAAGDTIEYGVTIEVSGGAGRGSAWPRVGVTSSVRPGETTAQAKRRVKTFVDTMLAQAIEELEK